MVTILLLIALVIIWAIPAGPQCPKCDSYSTKTFHNVNDEKYPHIKSIGGCYDCHCLWDLDTNKPVA